MSFHIVIPARYHSSRLPGKVLEVIDKKPMLQHVYESAQASGAESIVIATEDERVSRVAKGFGATVCFTQDSHETGTDRIAEVVSLMDYDDDAIIVGLQADEPFIPHKVIVQVAEDLASHSTVKLASLCQSITDIEELFDPNVTKVVLNHRKHALYFSRAPIPWERDSFLIEGSLPKKLNAPYYRHIGIYAYRPAFFAGNVEIERPDIEKMEQLEQLRFLWQGGRILMSIAKQFVPPGIDTPEDLMRARSVKP